MYLSIFLSSRNFFAFVALLPYSSWIKSFGFFRITNYTLCETFTPPYQLTTPPCTTLNSRFSNDFRLDDVYCLKSCNRDLMLAKGKIRTHTHAHPHRNARLSVLMVSQHLLQDSHIAVWCWLTLPCFLQMQAVGN